MQVFFKRLLPFDCIKDELRFTLFLSPVYLFSNNQEILIYMKTKVRKVSREQFEFGSMEDNTCNFLGSSFALGV